MPSKNVRRTNITNSVYAILSSIGLQTFVPMFMSDNDPVVTLIIFIVRGYGIFSIAHAAMTWSKFDKIFENLNLGINGSYPILKSKKINDYSTFYKFTLPTGLSTEDIEKVKVKIEEHFGKKINIHFLDRGLFGIEMFHDSTAKMYDYDDTITVDGEIAFPMGYDNNGRLITCVLSNGDNNVHMMIASTSGGGKSILLRVILTYLITKKKVDLYLIDLKRTELAIFENCGCVKEVCYNSDDVLGLLQKITNIMQKRYDIFKNNKVRDIQSYNKKFKKSPMKFILVAIDEFSELMEDDKSQRELERIAALSRASGISLIICTQRPDAKVISSRIKANISVIAGLRTNTDINSRVIMDNDSLSNLRGNGHCIFRYGIKDIELQGMFIDDYQIEELIKPFEVDKVKESKLTVKSDKIKFDINDLEVFMK